jgi:hypothetical protein
MGNLRATHEATPLFPSSQSPLLEQLQAGRAYPSVSILLTTTPGATWSAHDVVRLHRLVDDAHRRLAGELPPSQVDPLVAELRQRAVVARRGPASRALALFVSEHHATTVRLPVVVRDRVIIDPTFATRDLVRAAALLPRYRLLTLSHARALLYEGHPGQLERVDDEVFPLTIATTRFGDTRRRPNKRFGRDAGSSRRDRFAGAMRLVEETLVKRDSVEPLPLVIAAIGRHLAECRRRPDLASLVVGSIRGSHDRTSPAQLDRLARPALRDALQSRQRDALARLAEARDSGRQAGGLRDTWLAAVERRVRLLCVEESYALPARASASGRELHEAHDPEHPEALDDVIDELIEIVALNGAETVIVDDGELAGLGRVAAITTS